MTDDRRRLTSALFSVGDSYNKEDIYRLLDVPTERRYGAWDTGYREYQDDCFIFANVGIPGRTGHDYANRWVTNAEGGEDLEWQGKTSSALRHPLTQQLLKPSGETLVFWRTDDRAPFTFAGAASVVSSKDTVPVSVTWSFAEGARQIVEESALLALGESQVRDRRTGQGIRIGSEEARAIENRAMALAIDHFVLEGWDVNDVSRYQPYDLHCSKGDRRLHVEVKGTKTDGASVLLTPNEVEFARTHPESMALFIVSTIETEQTDAGFAAKNGVINLLQPWRVDEGTLMPVGFNYKVPQTPKPAP